MPSHGYSFLKQSIEYTITYNSDFYSLSPSSKHNPFIPKKQPLMIAQREVRMTVTPLSKTYSSPNLYLSSPHFDFSVHLHFH